MGIGVLGLVLLCVGLFVYFLPPIIASSREHTSVIGVFLLTLFLGWTLIGWVGALVWAVSGPTNAIKPTALTGPVTYDHAGNAVTPVDTTYRACPFCAEQILSAARKCKHCGSEVEPTT